MAGGLYVRDNIAKRYQRRLVAAIIPEVSVALERACLAGAPASAV
jgi:hypothetical protein